jgi:haloacetate dehalogenase
MVELWAEDLTTAPIAWAGHLPHEERPTEINAALESFLAPWQGCRQARIARDGNAAHT